MRIATLDCFAGISGDMFLGALLDAGVPLTVLVEAITALGLNASLEVERVDRSGITATKVQVLEGGALAEAAGQHTHSHTHTDLPSLAPQEHTHAHAGAEEHTHTHEHMHEGTHTHEHQHEHAHSHEHTHDQAPTHAHEHKHTHSHTHEGELTDPHTHEHPEDAHEHSHGHTHDHPHVHGRSLTQIRTLIASAPLAPAVQAFATHAFELLGASEAKIHNVPVDAIHFHEVGAVDAIVDIVGAAAGVDYLQRGDGELRWYCTAINVGGGMVECAHGTFPVPAPATADLLRGLPTYSAHVQKELVTPTGAAILRALAPEFAPQPAARISSIGYGAGTRNPKGFPNVLRLSLGEAVGSAFMSADLAPAATIHTDNAAQHGEVVALLETAIDDATPQLLAYVAEQALAAGALDVMMTPVMMKKGRAATLVTVLANPADSAAMQQMLLRETTTLGVRVHHQQRTCLERHHIAVGTAFGEIRIKIGSLQGELLNAAPEYEDCRAAAAQHHVPLKQVMQAAAAAYAATKPQADEALVQSR